MKTPSRVPRIVCQLSMSLNHANKLATLARDAGVTRSELMRNLISDAYKTRPVPERSTRQTHP
jgi:DNA-binding phage protein